MDAKPRGSMLLPTSRTASNVPSVTAYHIFTKVLPPILKFQVRHILIIFTVSIISFIIPLFVEYATIPTTTSLTDASKSTLQRNLEDPIYKWLIIAHLAYDFTNLNGVFLLNRGHFKVNLGPLDVKLIPRTVFSPLMKSATRITVGFITLSLSHVDYGTFMAITQGCTYIVVSVIYHTHMLTHVPYPLRWKQWLTLSLGSQLLEFSIVWLPLLPISASMLMDGPWGTVTKAMIAFVAMFLFRYMAISHHTKQLSVALEHDIKKGAAAANQIQPSRTLKLDHKALSELTTREMETIEYVAAVSKNVITTRVRAGSVSSVSLLLSSSSAGGSPGPIQQTEKLAIVKKPEINAIMEEDGTTQSMTLLMKSESVDVSHHDHGEPQLKEHEFTPLKSCQPTTIIDSGLSSTISGSLQKPHLPPIISKADADVFSTQKSDYLDAEERSDKPNKASAMNEQLEVIRNHGYLACSLFYFVNWLIVLRQKYTAESYFYITAFLSCFSEFVARMIIGRLLFMKINQVGVDVAGYNNDVEAATTARNEKVQITAATNVLELVSQQGFMKVFPPILKFQVKHILILFAISVLTFILPLLVEYLTTPSTASPLDASKSTFQRNLEDPIYKWLLIAPLGYDFINFHGVFIVNRSQVKINFGPFGVKQIPRNIIPCLIKSVTRLTVGFITLGVSRVDYGVFMAITQGTTYVVISIVYHTLMLTHVPYPDRIKHWLTLSLGSQLLEFSMVWLPLLPISASMFMEGASGTIAKALIACITMFLFRYMAVSHTSRQLAVSLEHDMKKGLKVVNKAQTIEEDREALRELTTHERETIHRYVNTISQSVKIKRTRTGSMSMASQVMPSSASGLDKEGSGTLMRKVTLARKADFGAIAEDDGTTEIAIPLGIPEKEDDATSHGGLSESVHAGSRVEQGYEEQPRDGQKNSSAILFLPPKSAKLQTSPIDMPQESAIKHDDQISRKEPDGFKNSRVPPPTSNISGEIYDDEKAQRSEYETKPSSKSNEQADIFRNHGYLGCSFFYIVNWVIVLRQSYASESYFYITAFLSCLSEFVARLIIGRFVYRKINQIGVDVLADIEGADAKDSRDEAYCQLQAAASNNVLELVSQQGCLFICTLLLFLFDMPPSPDGSFKSFLSFSAVCYERITWTHTDLIYRSLFILALQNLFMYALIVFEHVYRNYPYDACVSRMKIHWASWYMVSAMIVGFMGAIMLVIRGLLYEEWDKTLLVCTLLRDSR
ncbi:hypothetical protein HDV05_007930 [Chytridiales sp. JEL 0842]|nr:hypothetical protein HDV05_007930 [Chytridiales sp. JEL 0842]